MSGYHPSDGRHRIRFDDATSRLLSMRGKPFSWVSPRSCASGYSPAMHEALARMGADNVALDGPRRADVPSAVSAATPPEIDPVTGGMSSPPPGFKPAPSVPAPVPHGQRICMFWPGDGLWYPGEVLRHDALQVSPWLASGKCLLPAIYDPFVLLSRSHLGIEGHVLPVCGAGENFHP